MAGRTFKLSPKQIEGGRFLDEEQAGSGQAVRLSPEQILQGAFHDGPYEGMGRAPTDLTIVRDDATTPTRTEAFGRGALQGASAGFIDEAAGAVKALAGDGIHTKDFASVPADYQRERDTIRTADRAAEEAHGGFYTGGAIAGGLATAPLLGAGSGAASTIARGAGYGAVTGAGTSEADTVGGLAADTVKGGAAGALGASVAIGAGKVLGKLASGAEGRLDTRLVREIGQDSTPTIKAALVANKQNIIQTARQYELDKVAGKPIELLRKTEGALDDVGKQIGDVYRGASDVPLPDVMRAMHKIEQKYAANPATKQLAKQVAGQIEDMRATWQGYPAIKQVPMVPAAEVHDFVSTVGKRAYATSNADPGTLAALRKETYGVVKDVLRGHVGANDAAAAEKLQVLDKAYGALKDISASAANRSDKVQVRGLFSGMDAVTFGVAGIKGVAGKWAVQKGLPMAAKATDRALAALYKAAQTGAGREQLMQMAARDGLPASIAERMAAWSATQQPAPAVH